MPLRGTPIEAPISGVKATKTRTFGNDQNSGRDTSMILLPSWNKIIKLTSMTDRMGFSISIYLLGYKDITVRLPTKVYNKKTNVNRILPFERRNPVIHKIGCVGSLFNCIDSHCGTRKAIEEEQRQLCDMHSYYGPQHQQLTEKPAKTCHSVAYFNAVAGVAARLLTPHGESIVHKTTNMLCAMLIKPKGPLEKMTHIVFLCLLKVWRSFSGTRCIYIRLV